MKKIMAIIFLAGLATILSAWSNDKPKILILIAREGSERIDLVLTKEVGVMTQMITNAGFLVETASVSGDPLIGSKVSLRIDRKLDDLRLEDYSGVIIPCLAQPFSVADKKVISLIQEIVKRNMPLATQRGSIEVLSQAGVLIGRGHTSGREELGTTGGTILGRGVFQDGNIITSSNCPWAEEYGYKDGTRELTERFIGMVKVYMGS